MRRLLRYELAPLSTHVELSVPAFPLLNGREQTEAAGALVEDLTLDEEVVLAFV